MSKIIELSEKIKNKNIITEPLLLQIKYMILGQMS